jgi:hypothetical protein
MDQTIQLEAYNTPLHGAKILYCLPSTVSSSSSSASAAPSPATVTNHPLWSDWISKLREPFRKKMCLTSSAFPFCTRTGISSYDATFHAKDSQDWTLALTYMTYAPKPLLVVIEEMAIPDGLWSKLPTGTTLLHLTSHPVSRLSPYDAIFFSPMEEVSTTYAEYTHRILQSVFRPTYSAKEHKEILQELRVARAGLAWTRVGEQHPQGSVYWYDPVNAQPSEYVTPQQLTELFSWLSEQFRIQAV